MAILPILLEGDPKLRQKSIRIRHVDDSLRKLAADMHETMDDAPGVGLAGPQVGHMRRIIVVHVPAEYQGEGEQEIRSTLINPEIVKSHGRDVAPEGCLSIPGWVGDVPRAELITVKAVNLDNREIRIKARGYYARVIQHEIDHLDGILFVDRVEDKSTLREVMDEEEEEADTADARPPAPAQIATSA
jgi:peptide deformylase